MSTSPHLQLPFILPGQAQKHVTHNEALLALDALTQLAVLDRHLSAPPADPELGDRYIVAVAPTGAWAGNAAAIAAYDGAAWLFHLPQPGWRAFVVDEAGFVTWNGAGWSAEIGLDGSVPRLGVNALADGTNRLAAKSDAILFSHDDVTPGSGDMRLTLNKLGAASSATLLYQTGYSGRAEIGTAGDDALHVKVSPDGSAWQEALAIDAATASVGLGTANPSTRLHVAGPVRVGQYAVAALPDAAASGAGAMIHVTDEAGGGVLAFSDGADWRRVTDRAVVS